MPAYTYLIKDDSGGRSEGVPVISSGNHEGGAQGEGCGLGKLQGCAGVCE